MKRVGLSIALVSTMASLLSACGGSSGGPGGTTTTDACKELNSNTFSCEDMVNDVVEFGVRPLVTDFKTQVQTLHDATDTYCAPLIASNTDSDNDLAAAQTAWTSAAATIQQLSVMQFGPLASDDTGLTSIYAWPTVSACNVDVQMVRGTLGSDNRAGMFAMEYLLFSDKGSKACTTVNGVPQSTTVDDWFSANTSATARQVDRCEYAQLVADDLVNKATAMESEWNSYDLSTAGSTLQAAIGTVADALFYVDKQTKDAKIKAALPQATDGVFDATKLESQFALQSKEAIINNLVGAKRILIANDDANTGFNDYFAALGREDIVTELVTALDAAIANAQAINGSLNAAVSGATNVEDCINAANSATYDANSPIDALCSLQHNIKTVTDLLKGKFVSGTAFTVPASSDGDAD